MTPVPFMKVRWSSTEDPVTSKLFVRFGHLHLDITAVESWNTMQARRRRVFGTLRAFFKERVRSRDGRKGRENKRKSPNI